MSKCIKCEKTENLRRCCECHKLFCVEHIEYSPDPYQEEINNDHTKVWECEECRYESSRAV